MCVCKYYTYTLYIHKIMYIIPKNIYLLAISLPVVTTVKQNVVVSCSLLCCQVFFALEPHTRSFLYCVKGFSDDFPHCNGC